MSVMHVLSLALGHTDSEGISTMRWYAHALFSPSIESQFELFTGRLQSTS